MKKIIILLWAVCFVTIGYGQNEGIRFETGTLENVLKKAKRTDKYVFIDCYTVWCGPCKRMAKDVFTHPKVAEYFNSTFINYKMDMEKGEGREVQKRYGVSAFPTFLFLDGEGNLIYKAVGVKEPDIFIGAAKEVFNDQNVLKLGQVYKQHLQDSAFMFNYFSKLKEARMSEDLQSAVNDYLNAMHPEQYLKSATWKLIREYVWNYQSPILKHLLEHRTAFFQAFGKEQVNEHVSEVFWNYYHYLSDQKSITSEMVEDFIAEVKAVKMTFTPPLLARLYLLKYYQSKDLVKLANTIDDLFTYGFISDDISDDPDVQMMIIMEIGQYCKAMTLNRNTDYNDRILKWFASLTEMYQSLEYRLGSVLTLYEVIEQSGDSALITKIGLQKDQLMKEYYRQYPPTHEDIETSKSMMDAAQYENMLKEMERLGVKIIE